MTDGTRVLESDERLLRRCLLSASVPSPDDLSRWGDFGVEMAGAEARAWARQSAGLGVYHKLVRATLRRPIELALPTVVACLGERFDAYFEAYLVGPGPRSTVLREVTEAFLEYCVPLWHQDPSLPEWLVELAQFELCEVQLGAESDHLDDKAGDSIDWQLTPDSVLSFAPAVRLRHYTFAVHRIQADPKAAAAAGSCWLLSYRDLDWRIRHCELTPLAAEILRGLLAGESMRNSITNAARAHSTPVTDHVLSGCNDVLGRLIDGGVMFRAALSSESAQALSESK